MLLFILILSARLNCVFVLCFRAYLCLLLLFMLVGCAVASLVWVLRCCYCADYLLRVWFGLWFMWFGCLLVLIVSFTCVGACGFVFWLRVFGLGFCLWGWFSLVLGGGVCYLLFSLLDIWVVLAGLGAFGGSWFGLRLVFCLRG